MSSSVHRPLIQTRPSRLFGFILATMPLFVALKDGAIASLERDISVICAFSLSHAE
jgi:hypothetical protein